MAATEGGTHVVRSFVNGIETVGGDHVDAALATALVGAWTMIVSVWVKQPRFDHIDNGCVVHHPAARDLVTAAMAPSEAKAS